MTTPRPFFFDFDPIPTGSRRFELGRDACGRPVVRPRVPSEAEKRWRDLAAATGLPAAGVVGGRVLFVGRSRVPGVSALEISFVVESVAS